MSRFAINTPYLIVVVCLVIAILGAVSVVQMPVDMFPAMNIPVVVVATFYSGMPPEQIEGDITYHLERFFTLASGIDHIESRSLNGVSIIRVYFQPNTNADIDAATIANLAVSDMKDLPPGTLPPVVLKSDASSLPVCLVTMNGEGMTDGNLKDIAQNFVRNQLASVHGAAIPTGSAGSTTRKSASSDAATRRTRRAVAGVGSSIPAGARVMRIPASAAAASKAADSLPGTEEAVSTAKEAGSRRRHSSHR